MGFSLQEILTKTEKTRKLVEDQLDGPATFHPEEASIYTGLGEDDQHNIRETLRKISLKDLILKLGLKEYVNNELREVLYASGTSGVAGAALLIPDKIYDVMYSAARTSDIVPLVTNTVDTPGSTLKVDLEVDGQFQPRWQSAPGTGAQETMQTGQVTITPALFSINPQITNELIEDSQFDIMEMHMANAGKEMGHWSTRQWLYLPMKEHATASTFGGDGTLNVQSPSAGTFYLSDVKKCIAENMIDGYYSDTIVSGPAIFYTLTEAEATVHPNYAWNDAVTVDLSQGPQVGKILGLNWIVLTKMITTETEGAAPFANLSGLYSTHWHQLVFNKQNASLWVRKRWLKIEKYSDPIRDLVGASVTCRQGGNLLYRDAMCVSGA